MFLLFNKEWDKSQFIKHVRNANTLVVSVLCWSGLFYYKTYADPFFLPYLQYAIISRCAIDLLLNTHPAIFIHHVSTIAFAVTTMITPHNIDNDSYKSSVFVSSELSNLFLVLRYYYTDKNDTYLVDSIFLATFFYTRLYLLIGEFFFDSSFNISLYFLVGINVYWGCVLIKKKYKAIRGFMKPYHTHINCEFLVQYTLFLSPMISSYMYAAAAANGNKPPIWEELMDVLSLTLLAGSSYFYHNALLNNISRTKNVLDDAIFPYYLGDITTISLKGFTIVAIIVLRMVGDNWTKAMILMDVAELHLLALYIFYDHHFLGRKRGNYIAYNGKETRVSTLVKFALVVDTCIGVYNTGAAKSHILLSSMLIFGITVVKPFYEMNHFFFHMSLLYQSYSTTLYIIKVN